MRDDEPLLPACEIDVQWFEDVRVRSVCFGTPTGEAKRVFDGLQLSPLAMNDPVSVGVRVTRERKLARVFDALAAVPVPRDAGTER